MCKLVSSVYKLQAGVMRTNHTQVIFTHDSFVTESADEAPSNLPDNVNGRTEQASS